MIIYGSCLKILCSIPQGMNTLGLAVVGEQLVELGIVDHASENTIRRKKVALCHDSDVATSFHTPLEKWIKQYLLFTWS
jgi:hypothetical protein